MKTLLFAALLFICTPAVAEAPPPPTAPPPTATNEEGVKPEIKFEEHKAKMLEFMDEQIARIEKGKACIQAAENPEAVRACRPDGKRLRHIKRGKRADAPGQNTPPPGR